MRRADSRGFTLIETLITVALTVVVMTALTSLIQYFYTATGSLRGQWAASQRARIEIGRAMDTVKQAAAVTEATPDAFAFDVVLDGATTTYTYAREGAALKVLIDGEETDVLATPLAGAHDVFSYFDDNGTQLDQPIDAAAVRSVIIHATVRTGSSDTTIVNGAAPRNLLP